MEEKSLIDEVRYLKEIIIDNKKEEQRKPKKFGIPFKARLNPSRLRKGFVIVVKIDENMSVDFIREPIIDGTIKMGDTYHAVEEFDIFKHKRNPLIFQPKGKLNPYNPLKGTHETYGQKYVMARMEGERITSKKTIGWGISIGILLLVAVGIYALFTGGGGG